MVFFTSDLHLNHAKVIQYSNRPFASVDEMNDQIIRRWNARVGVEDTVYLLGDVALGPQSEIQGLVHRLNGVIHLIWGNHDSDLVKGLSRWASSQPYAEIKVGKEPVCLFHYPMRAWNRSHHGAWHFWGHAHGHLPAFGRSLDVGVDCWDYQPVTFAEIEARIQSLGLRNNFMKHHPDQSDDRR